MSDDSPATPGPGDETPASAGEPPAASESPAAGQSPGAPESGAASESPAAEVPAPDEAPTTPVAAEAPGAAADETPTEIAPPAAEAAPSPAPAASAPGGAPDRGRGVFVPVWVAIVVGILVVAGLGFAIGWIAAPADDSDASNAVATQPTTGDQANGNSSGNSSGNGNDSGNSGTTPSVPGDNRDGTVVPPLLRGAFLGVTVETAADDGGARITAVADNGPAADAGLQAGDVITAVDGDNVSSSLELIRAIRQHEPDDSITVTYTRNGNSSDAKVTLAERPTNQ